MNTASAPCVQPRTNPVIDKIINEIESYKLATLTDEELNDRTNSVVRDGRDQFVRRGIVNVVVYAIGMLSWLLMSEVLLVKWTYSSNAALVWALATALVGAAIASVSTKDMLTYDEFSRLRYNISAARRYEQEKLAEQAKQTIEQAKRDAEIAVAERLSVSLAPSIMNCKMAVSTVREDADGDTTVHLHTRTDDLYSVGIYWASRNPKQRYPIGKVFHVIIADAEQPTVAATKGN